VLQVGSEAWVGELKGFDSSTHAITIWTIGDYMMREMRLTFRLTLGMLEAIKAKAIELGISKSKVIEMALLAFLSPKEG
jgi:predicted DNA binding CopG/RHH family protein